jgi:hypothetical protein
MNDQIARLIRFNIVPAPSNIVPAPSNIVPAPSN